MLLFPLFSVAKHSITYTIPEDSPNDKAFHKAYRLQIIYPVVFCLSILYNSMRKMPRYGHSSFIQYDYIEQKGVSV